MINVIRHFIIVCGMLEVSVMATAQFNNENIAPYCISISPINHKTVFCGSERQYMYRSFDGGHNWDSVFTPIGQIQQIAFSPSDSNRILIAGYYSQRTFYYSKNQGKSWLPMLFPQKQFTQSDSAEIYVFSESMRFDLNKTSLVYAAVTATDHKKYSETWFCRSSDAGETWDTIKVFDRSYFPNPCYMLQYDDSTFILGGYGGNIIKSKDYGQTWLKVHSGAKPYPNSHQKVPTIRKSRIKSSTCFASLLNEGGGHSGGLLRSDDAGDTWRQIAFTDTSIWSFELVELENRMNLMVGGFIYAGNDPNIYYPLISTSSDGGESWNRIEQGATWNCNGDWSVFNIKCDTSVAEKPKYYFATVCGLMTYIPTVVNVPAEKDEDFSGRKALSINGLVDWLTRNYAEKRLCLYSCLGRLIASGPGRQVALQLNHQDIKHQMLVLETDEGRGEVGRQCGTCQHFLDKNGILN